MAIPMPVDHAAEVYLRGFYIRSGGKDHGWDEYGVAELPEARETFDLLYDNGGGVLKIDHIYSTGDDVTVILEVRMPTAGSVDCLTELMREPSNEGYPNSWVRDFIIGLMSDSGHGICYFPVMSGESNDAKIIVSEEY